MSTLAELNKNKGLMMMRRRDFLKLALGGIFIGGTVGFLSGCSAKINKNVYEDNQGAPWHCTACGYLTRSTADLSDSRCPRCYQKSLIKITEEELKTYLDEQKSN